MPKCQNCGHRWSLKDTCKIAFKYRGTSGRTCSRCGDKQYISKKSLNRIGIAAIVSLVLTVVVRPLLPQDFGTSLLLAVPLAVGLIVANLSLVELSNVQQGET
ncbi:CXXC-20-CXXC protein [Planomicrobium stackebrandtii]|uniref:CXXC-20-CXXC protein n=1 Tax=Planomicrobium stackebrandtii TaxID=253160 RepID=A0ABU0GX04_9BACL|nr:TIGR04104 family putative zinc finger protein [Planomicrobium stackebrandtii]MDQ0429459.1 CXXC-20-CXXC protein [Planomicrobium stackebrandtii]